MRYVLTIIIGTLIFAGNSYGLETPGFPFLSHETPPAAHQESPQFHHGADVRRSASISSGAGFADIINGLLPPIQKTAAGDMLKSFKETSALLSFL